MNAINFRTLSPSTRRAYAYLTFTRPDGQPGYVALAATLCVACTVLLMGGHTASAAALAVDNADELAYSDGWQDGDNGGFGFGPWFLGTLFGNPTFGGHFIGDSSANGSTPPSGNINTNGVSFGLYANTDEFSFAGRAFTGGPLGVGQSFILDMDHGDVQLGGSVGFNLGSRLSFGRSTDNEYFVIDADGVTITDVPVTDDGLTVFVGLTGADTYELAIQPFGSGATVIPGTLAGSGDILGFELFNDNAGTSPNNDVYFNFIEVAGAAIPEPATGALTAMAAFAFGLVRRRRRRRA